MIQVVISVGSNCGDRKKSVGEALEWLKSILIQTVSSDIYETPCAMESGKAYVNAVIGGYFTGIGYDLEDLLKEKEHQMGRTSECREKGEVPVDIDLVIMDGEVVKPWDYKQKFFRIGFDQISSKLG